MLEVLNATCHFGRRDDQRRGEVRARASRDRGRHLDRNPPDLDDFLPHTTPLLPDIFLRPTMGNDGGSIPTRRELVKEAARNPTVTELKSTLAERLHHLWTTDPLSNQPLAEPIVSDCAGRLYSKASILEFLLPGDEADDSGSVKAEQGKLLGGTVTSSKDVVELKFSAADLGAAAATSGPGRWKCPISNEPLGPTNKAIYLVPCGHVFSATALREVDAAAASKTCLVCNEPYAENDNIPILPTAEAEVARLVLRIKTLQESGLRHSLKPLGGKSKRDKKDKKIKEGIDGKRDEQVPKLVVAAAGPTINNAATRALTEKVMREQEAGQKRKLDNANVQSLFSGAKDPKQKRTNADFMTRGFSIPANAKR